MKLKSICTAKLTIKKMNKQPILKDIVLSSYTPGQRLIIGMYKELEKLSTINQSINIPVI